MRCPKCKAIFMVAPAQAVPVVAPVISVQAAPPPPPPRAPLTFDEPHDRLPPQRSGQLSDLQEALGEEGPFDPPGRLRGRGVGIAAVVLLAVWILLHLGTLGLTLLAIATNNFRIVSGMNIAWVATILLFFATGVVFLCWFAAAHTNLRILGSRGLEYSANWAVGGFFIPVLNLFRPYQVAQEIWKGSDPDVLAPQGALQWMAKSGSGVALAWWLTWTVGSLGTASLLLLVRDPFLQLLVIAVTVFVRTIAAILLLIFIIAVLRRQSEKYDRLLDELEYADER